MASDSRRPGGGVILDGHPVPPREKGLYLPAMCRGQTQVDARSGGGSSSFTFALRAGVARTPRGAWGEGACVCDIYPFLQLALVE